MEGSQSEEDSARTGPQYQLGYLTAVEDMDNPDYMTRFHFPSKAGGKPVRTYIAAAFFAASASLSAAHLSAK